MNTVCSSVRCSLLYPSKCADPGRYAISLLYSNPIYLLYSTALNLNPHQSQRRCSFYSLPITLAYSPPRLCTAHQSITHYHHLSFTTNILSLPFLCPLNRFYFLQINLIVLHHIALHCTALHCATLHCCSVDHHSVYGLLYGSEEVH